MSAIAQAWHWLDGQSLVVIFFVAAKIIVLLNWNSGLSVCPSTKGFSNFDVIWCVGRPQRDMHTSMTSTRSKVKVTEPLKFRKLHFSRSVSSLPFWRGAQNWWLIMITWDQSAGCRGKFLNFLLSKLSHDFKLSGMLILQDFQRAIFPYCLMLESHGLVCW